MAPCWPLVIRVSLKGRLTDGRLFPFPLTAGSKLDAHIDMLADEVRLFEICIGSRRVQPFFRPHPNFPNLHHPQAMDLRNFLVRVYYGQKTKVKALIRPSCPLNPLESEFFFSRTTPVNPPSRPSLHRRMRLRPSSPSAPSCRAWRRTLAASAVSARPAFVPQPMRRQHSRPSTQPPSNL